MAVGGSVGRGTRTGTCKICGRYYTNYSTVLHRRTDMHGPVPSAFRSLPRLPASTHIQTARALFLPLNLMSLPGRRDEDAAKVTDRAPDTVTTPAGNVERATIAYCHTHMD